MRWLPTIHRVWALAAVGVAAGVAAGLAISLATNALAQGASGSGAVFDVTHVPPLLTVPDASGELVYDVHCSAAGVDDPEANCSVSGTVFARRVGVGSFREIPLERRDPVTRQLAATVPDELLDSDAFEYFAVFESAEAEARLTVPPGAQSAPSVSRRLRNATPVLLGRHSFGEARRSGQRLVFARWGDGPDAAGLEEGRNLEPVGASAFDVDASGAIVVLDHANRRLLRWTKGTRAPVHVPVSINGTIADLASGGDGSFYVMETTARNGKAPLIRRFDDHGRELEAVEAAEQGTAQIRIGPDGPVVLQRPSHQWMPAAVAGVPASQAAQLQRGRMGRLLRSGGEVVVLSRTNELRVAVVAGGRSTRSWRITSETPLGEVQLAEPVGRRFVVVVRLYDGRSDEFAVLLLDRRGLVSRTTVDAADWAEAAPLGRFRLVGRDLYRLGSTPAGVFVDRFDLEVR
ncbi:MAG TPA: hypothetical protein VMK83_02985 [Gaiellaceae bacterium]|nr:hypothetical protein [Gaiellaceae bacterium]